MYRAILAATFLGCIVAANVVIGVEMSEHYAEVAATRLRTVTLGYRPSAEQDALDLDGGAA